jgi:hypothetical protein
MATLPIPPGLPGLLAHYRDESQQPVRFRPSTWIRTLAAVPAAQGIVQVLDEDRWALASTSKRRPGDRLIDRSQLNEVAAKTSLADDRGLRTLFLLVQVWGAGTSGGRTCATPGSLSAIQTHSCGPSEQQRACCAQRTGRQVPAGRR